jgi:outer membrane lipoprotein LolB
MRAACALALALAAAGCATLGPASGEAYEFELSARIAVRYRDEASSGTVSWRHRRAGDEVLISGPLGQGVARLERDGETFTLTTATQEWRSMDAESLTERVLGYRLPLAGLADWVRARPWALGPSALAEYDSDGRLAILEQAGWRIEYLEYSGALPARLRLAYPGIELRLAISEWK